MLGAGPGLWAWEAVNIMKPNFLSPLFKGRTQGLLQQFSNRLKLSENNFLIILAVIIGVLGGLGNYLFRKTIELIHWAVVEQSLELFSISLEHWSLQRLLVAFLPMIGGLL